LPDACDYGLVMQSLLLLRFFFMCKCACDNIVSRKKFYVLYSTHYRRQTDEARAHAFFQSCYDNIKLKQHLLLFSFALKNTLDLTFLRCIFPTGKWRANDCKMLWNSSKSKNSHCNILVQWKLYITLAYNRFRCSMSIN